MAGRYLAATGNLLLAVSGENHWPPLGRTTWPLTRRAAGSPGLGVLRRLRPVPNRSAVDAPSSGSLLETGGGARFGTVPVWRAENDGLQRDYPCLLC